jgi:NAD(P)-dependent dehydrogenase (short-subunit alcohol dehydrogenase family)
MADVSATPEVGAAKLRLAGLEQRTAVVTGAARGIGKRISEVLRDQGANVHALDLEPPEIEGVRGLGADVTSAEAVDNAFAAVEAQSGAVEVLVLNAGVFIIEPFESTSAAQWKTTIAVNLTGAFLCAQRALPGMRAGGFGRLVAIGSSAGVSGGAKSVGAYAASKAGVMTLMKSIANEYASEGIRANALAPALIDTEMISSMPDMRNAVPIGRLGTPDDIAGLTAFLCSEHGSYITGEIVDVNGGFLID